MVFSVPKLVADVKLRDGGGNAQVAFESLVRLLARVAAREAIQKLLDDVGNKTAIDNPAQSGPN